MWEKCTSKWDDDFFALYLRFGRKIISFEVKSSISSEKQKSDIFKNIVNLAHEQYQSVRLVSAVSREYVRRC